MRVFMFQAALYCEECGESLCSTHASSRPSDPLDESSYDSDDYPKGPYDNGGGEADTPQHCDACKCFLENPLTPEGERYVREAFALNSRNQVFSSVAPGKVNETLDEWSDFYGIPRDGKESDAAPSAPDLKAQLADLIAQGLTLSDALTAFGEKFNREDSSLSAYSSAATNNDELETDSSGIVSPGSDAGAWVLSWQWVTNEKAGIEDDEESNQ